LKKIVPLIATAVTSACKRTFTVKYPGENKEGKNFQGGGGKYHEGQGMKKYCTNGTNEKNTSTRGNTHMLPLLYK
jgi:hypothetical protein